MSNTPGVFTYIEDNFYGRSLSNIPSGPRLLLIGTRTTADGTGDVRDLEPLLISRESQAISVFGDGSALHRGYIEANAGGATKIYAIGLPSDTVFDYNLGTVTSASFDLATGGDLDLMGEAFAAAEIVRPDVIVPWGRGSHSTEWENPATPDNDPGDFGFYADNSTDRELSFAYKVAKHCAAISTDSYPVFAVMGVKPYVGTSENMLTSEVNSHLSLPDLIDREDMADLATDENYGKHLVVVAGELRPVGYRTFGYSNGAAMLAADSIQRLEWSSGTGQIIYNLAKMRYTPAKGRQLTLISKAVVPVSVTFERAPIWVDVMTHTPVDSDYARLTTVRITFTAMQVVRSAASRFIGKPATIDTRSALETSVISGLRGMQQQGALYASNPSFTYNPITNEVIIDLTLVPAFEVRTIEVRVAVNLASSI